MKVNILEIAGLPQAIKALYISKLTLNDEISNEIDEVIEGVTDRNGFIKSDSKVSKDNYNKFEDYMNKIIKWGIQYDHASLLDFIQIYTHVEGLHRGAGDDCFC